MAPDLICAAARRLVGKAGTTDSEVGTLLRSELGAPFPAVLDVRRRLQAYLVSVPYVRYPRLCWEGRSGEC